MRPVFEKLHPAIQRALAKYSFTEPTEPQIKAIPAVLDGENILVTATTPIVLPWSEMHLSIESMPKNLLSKNDIQTGVVMHCVLEAK